LPLKVSHFAFLVLAIASAVIYSHQGRQSRRRLISRQLESPSCTAHIGRLVPELELDLPANAIGKDYVVDGGVLARSPSGSGYQVSLFGVLGFLVAVEEGIELNLLGLNVGIDPLDFSLRLPGLGRVGP
jgi:hypothetical protein